LALADGYRTGLMIHKPANPSKLPVLMLHGIQSHPGWFVGSAEALRAAGHPVYQFQRRGSGRSPQPRGHAASPRQLLADLDSAATIVRLETGANRFHLVGISWGGKYAACWATDSARRARLASLTMIAPGLAPRVDLPAGRKLLVGLSLLAGGKARFRIPLNEPELFTDNPAKRQFIAADPYRLRKATARFLYVSRQMDWMLTQAREGCLAGLPVNLFLASRDEIIDNDRTLAMARRLAGERLNVVRLDGAHTLEFQADPKPFYDELRRALPASK
jgi:alpha-beta hydrolase superfamily lysophospholipase